MGNLRILLLREKHQINKNWKELISGVELYSSAKEILEKPMTECCRREIQDEGENKVSSCNWKGCLDFKPSAN